MTKVNRNLTTTRNGQNFSADLSKFMKGIGLGEEEAMVVSEEEEEKFPS